MNIQVIKRRVSPEQQRRRDHIISCTLELMGRYGSAISMEAVAEASGTSRSTLYRNFSSKEHLISEVTLDAGHQLIRLLAEHPPHGTTLGEKIDSLCQRITQLAEVNNLLLTACIANITSDDPAVIDAQDEIEQLISGIFSAIRGEVEPANQEMIDKAIFRFLLGGFLLATTGKLSFEELSRDLTQFCQLLMGEHWDTRVT